MHVGKFGKTIFPNGENSANLVTLFADNDGDTCKNDYIHFADSTPPPHNVTVLVTTQWKIYDFYAGLPDGIFSKQIWVIFGGSCNGRCCIFFVHLVFLKPFGILYVHMDIW
jgi:hypothetical protein